MQPHPTLTDILANPLVEEFLADASPDMTRADLSELAARWLSAIDDEYADAGITLTVADMNHALSGMVDAALARFTADEMDHLDRVAAGLVFPSGAAADLRHYYGV